MFVERTPCVDLDLVHTHARMLWLGGVRAHAWCMVPFTELCKCAATYRQAYMCMHDWSLIDRNIASTTAHVHQPSTLFRTVGNPFVQLSLHTHSCMWHTTKPKNTRQIYSLVTLTLSLNLDLPESNVFLINPIILKLTKKYRKHDTSIREIKYR